jgi:peptide/nickel transport system permease protein
MLAYAARRILLMIPTFVGVTFIAFLIMHLAPGDPVELYFHGGLAAGAQGASPERLAEIQRAKEQERHRLGLDRPLPVQYAIWFKRLVTLDLGESFKDRRPVWDKIRERLPVTITLNVISILITYAIAIPLGIYSSVRPGSWPDAVATTAVFMLYSLPSFWVGTLILIYFCGGDYFLWFPPAGLHSLDYETTWPWIRQLRDYAWHIAMPVVCETYAAFAALSRYMRSSMLENALQDYVRTARAKGLAESVVMFRHVLRNALIPILTGVVVVIPLLFLGSLLSESFFGIPGLGSYTIDAISAQDFAVVRSMVFIGSVLYIVGLILTDISYTVVDPRIRLN